MAADCPNCAALRRQVTDLQAELEAWREVEADDRTDEAAMLRLHRVKEVLRRGAGAEASYLGGSARLLVRLMSPPGRLRRWNDLLDAIAVSANHDLAHGSVLVAAWGLRKRLAGLGVNGVVQTIWGMGLIIEASDAARVRAVFGEGVFA